MNTSTLAAGAIAALTLAPVGALAGPLNPPAGPIAPTPGPEPRIAVNATNTPGDADATPSLYKITQPGSYYLAGNVTGVAGKIGIEIDADSVTLDLAGFEVRGGAKTLDGVLVTPGRRSVTVRNGSLKGWGGAGLTAVGGPNADACLYQDLRVIENGTDAASYALDVGGASTVTNCVAAFNLGTGIRGNNGTLISGCAASGNGGDGIICGAGTIRDCLARGNGGDGLRAGAASVISGCSSTANIGAGITISAGTMAHNNACLANGWGIYIYGDASTADSNTLVGNGIGVEIVDPSNVFIRNSVRRNVTNDAIVAGNDVGPFQSVATSTSPWCNFAE